MQNTLQGMRRWLSALVLLAAVAQSLAQTQVAVLQPFTAVSVCTPFNVSSPLAVTCSPASALDLHSPCAGVDSPKHSGSASICRLRRSHTGREERPECHCEQEPAPCLPHRSSCSSGPWAVTQVSGGVLHLSTANGASASQLSFSTTDAIEITVRQGLCCTQRAEPQL